MLYTNKIERIFLMDKLGYLGAPFTHASEDIKKERFNIINKVTSILMVNEYLYVYSPISYSSPLNKTGIIEQCWESWKKFDLFMIRKCDYLFVLTLPGWDSSVGLSHEIQEAKRNLKPIYYLDYNEFME